MKMFIIKLTLLMVSLNSSMLAWASNDTIELKVKVCTKQDEINADNQPLSIRKNWNALYKFYQKFNHCDDGSIAEGFSEAIVTLLKDRWLEFFRMQSTWSRDLAFHTFVIKHVDASTNYDDLKMIASYTQNRCPKNYQKLCLSIDAAAQQAMKDIDAVKK
jgi:hypothetical protein